MDKYNVKIPENEIVNIKISGAFYYRLRLVFQTILESRSQEDMLSLLKRIQEEEYDDNPHAFNLETMLILLRSIEQKFNDENKIKELDINSTQD